MRKNKKGFFIVLEGTDGSGKTTQFKLLIKKLKQFGFKFKTIDFPQYGQPSAYFVEQYLNGNYGGAKDVGPYKASLFYALDRFSAAQKINNWIDAGFIVVSNRYVLSNAGHQGGKIKTSGDRNRFWKWLFDLEYNILGIPQPDLNILIHMPAEVAQKLVDKKSARQYIKGKKRDLHEADLKHLQDSEKVYLLLARQQRLPVVECFTNSQLLKPEVINQIIWKIVNSKIKQR